MSELHIYEVVLHILKTTYIILIYILVIISVGGPKLFSGTKKYRRERKHCLQIEANMQNDDKWIEYCINLSFSRR